MRKISAPTDTANIMRSMGIVINQIERDSVPRSSILPGSTSEQMPARVKETKRNLAFPTFEEMQALRKAKEEDEEEEEKSN